MRCTAYLRDINKELLIPNLQLIPPNTISLLETNPKFIESYMVGLNHEMGRELLWREYPTDLRGSYFRQFWEVKGVSNPDTPADAEQLKDITKIHTLAVDNSARFSQAAAWPERRCADRAKNKWFS